MRVDNERTALRPCTCQHPYQDAIYGKGLRLHNKTGYGRVNARTKRPPWRCTVCGKERE